VLVGVPTNQGFHVRLLRDPAFRAGDIDIQFLDRRADLLAPSRDERRTLDLVVAAALAEDEARALRRPAVADATPSTSAWLREGRRESLR
jgi:acetyl/propionyl-CoA carboxylase alpha subunit